MVVKLPSGNRMLQQKNMFPPKAIGDMQMLDIWRPGVSLAELPVHVACILSLSLSFLLPSFCHALWANTPQNHAKPSGLAMKGRQQ